MSAEASDQRDSFSARMHQERMDELAIGARVEAMKVAGAIAGTRVNRAFTVSDVIGDAVLIADFIITGKWQAADATEEKIA